MGVLIWPEQGEEADVASRLLEIAGPGGVGTNTDSGLAFDVSEQTAIRFYQEFTAAMFANSAKAAKVPDLEPLESYDPSLHSVAEVLEYLRSATSSEQARVLAAETEGKGRRTITGWSAPAVS